MEKLSSTEIITALAEMEDELNETKDGAEELQGQVSEVNPDELSFDLGDMEGEEKEHAEKIKTPEDAKKVLNEAKDDLQLVIDNLDGLIGQSKEEQKQASVKRFNEKYAASLVSFKEQSEKAIADAKDSIKHWTYLTKARKSFKNSSLKDTIETVKEAKKAWSFLDGLFGKKTIATAIPPTGAEFSGDKPATKGDPAKVELRHWQAGADEFNKDKKKEDSMPNPSVDKRLMDEGNPHNDAPFVNAKFIKNTGDKFSSYWDVYDSKSKNRIQASFNALPSDIFSDVPEQYRGFNDATLSIFASALYGNQIVDNVMQIGIGNTQKSLNAKSVSTAGYKLSAEDENGKGSIRKYYKDAYGDATYAKELTSGASDTQMDTAYKPEREEVKEVNDEKKDGPGKISNKQPDLHVVRAKTQRAVELARKLASRGSIEFSYGAIEKKASELYKMPDNEFNTLDKVLDNLPITNIAALKSATIPKVAHIPDTETGVVGNTTTGVSDPKSEVKTEDIDSNVAKDAKIASQVIPQMRTDSVQSTLNISSAFTTTENILKSKGVDLSKVRKPQYKSY
jgi:hypothetical protein